MVGAGSSGGWIINGPIALTCVLLLSLPLWIEEVGLYPYLGVEVVIWMIYALGFNLLLGLSGLPSFGHGAYFGVGA
ncbi:MAG: branched-chain amino acid transporter permease, partial [Microvirga sp.]|nr:branched-chain amino acid transporter permease [Microvirga sp.]